ncbi:hypothetical protein O6H91_23G013700 [Diphasiastrum complanatum]|uniref:Uncharacterized protein n=1 Tax=Diphasiastrum complanatum TaxID=34168 RepID=A0ACC2A8F4_DIPCM|nr:hypothetical protein O6H91_23G013700 [Diphasiastrum complanatum]
MAWEEPSSSSSSSSSSASAPYSPSSSSFASGSRMPRLAGASSGLPESFVEAVVYELALQIFTARDPLSVAPVIANVFRVCSTWRNVSRSELLWKNLCRAIWHVENRYEGLSWRQQYVRVHLTSLNFKKGNPKHHILDYETSQESNENGIGNVCRCLAISGRYMAGGFFDGSVRIFDLRSRLCISTMKSGHEDRFGPLSRAIAGLFVELETVVFASLEGSVFTANIFQSFPRCVYVGNVIQDGALINFTGSNRWWVGLYAGSPGNCIRIWDATSQETVFRGGNIMDNDAMSGWNLFVEQAGQIGRVQISNDALLVAASRTSLNISDIENDGLYPRLEREEQMAVEALAVKDDKMLTASYDGSACIRSLPDLDEVCRIENLDVEDAGQLSGSLNSRQCFLCISGEINVWDAISGVHLYNLEEPVGDAYDLVASDEYVVASNPDFGLNLWDFTP